MAVLLRPTYIPLYSVRNCNVHLTYNTRGEGWDARTTSLPTMVPTEASVLESVQRSSQTARWESSDKCPEFLIQSNPQVTVQSHPIRLLAVLDTFRKGGSLPKPRNLIRGDPTVQGGGGGAGGMSFPDGHWAAWDSMDG